MDSLTQIVLGAAVGEAVLGKKVGNKAMLWGAIAGTIPDLDVFIKYFTDPITTTELHRGISHSLFFSIVMAPILGWLVSQLYQKKNEASVKNWSWLFFWALVTHPILDAHTTWGTQFFWPFDYRLAFKNIFVADPLYTVPFLIFTLIALFHKRDNPRRRKFNNIGLIVSTSYMALTFVFKGVGHYHFLEAMDDQKIDYVEMDSKPTPLNTLLWNSQIETETGFRVGYYSFFDTKAITFSTEFPKNHHLIEAYKDQKVIKQLIKISVGWYFIEEIEGELFFVDTRFGQMGFGNDAPFVYRYALHIDENGQVEAVQVRPDSFDIKGMFSELGERIKGN